MLKFGALLFVLYLAFSWFERGPAPLAISPGMLAPNAPKQRPLRNEAAFTYAEHRIQPLASFALEARVLRREDYRFDRAAKLSPVDLALGWGPMSDTAVLSQLEIRQSHRWYHWRAEELPISREEIEHHSANMHLIPATPAIAKRVDRIRPGQLVRISGKLVGVEGPDHWHWRSSLSREDTGDGSCEVIWVEEITTR